MRRGRGRSRWDWRRWLGWLGLAALVGFVALGLYAWSQGEVCHGTSQRPMESNGCLARDPRQPRP